MKVNFSIKIHKNLYKILVNIQIKALKKTNFLHVDFFEFLVSDGECKVNIIFYSTHFIILRRFWSYHRKWGSILVRNISLRSVTFFGIKVLWNNILFFHVIVHSLQRMGARFCIYMRQYISKKQPLTK